MSQEDVPKVDSINMSTREDEIDFDKTIIALMEKSEDGSVRLPITTWPEKLLPHLQYTVAQFIHSN